MSVTAKGGRVKRRHSSTVHNTVKTVTKGRRKHIPAIPERIRESFELAALLMRNSLRGSAFNGSSPVRDAVRKDSASSVARPTER